MMVAAFVIGLINAAFIMRLLIDEAKIRKQKK
jgi:hypothetical protein